MEDDFTLDGGHTAQYTYIVKKFTPETIKQCHLKKFSKKEIHQILNMKTIKLLSTPSLIKQKCSSSATTHSVGGTKSHLSNVV